MANDQKITEIIDEKAFQEWEAFVQSLGKGQLEMAKMVNQTVELNKEMSKANTFKAFSKDATAAALAMQKLAQAQEKTKQMQERSAQAALKTIELTEKRAKKEAEAQAAVEKAAASKEAASKRMASAASQEAKSVTDANIKVVQSEKDVAKGLEASEAAARSFTNEVKQKAEAEKRATASAEAFARAQNVLGENMSDTIKIGMRLKAELNELEDAKKRALESDNTGDLVRINGLIVQQREAIRQNNVEIKRFARENISVESSMDSLASKLAIARGEYSKLSKEERETSEEGKKLLATITKLDEEYKDLKKSVGQHQDEVGNYALVWNKVPGPIRETVDALHEASKAEGAMTFQTVIQGLKDMAKAAWAFITTPLGATIAALAAVLGGAKLWFDYNLGLEKATRLTKQLTDLSGDELRNLRTEVQATADTFDKEFNETMRASNVLAKEFGITYGEAVDLINTGFIKGADASGTFLDDIREYAPQLRAAGLEADEMISIMVRSQKEGIFNDKAVDTIKEATLRLREMTKATRTALEGLGIDADDVQKKLLSGQMTMFEVIQMVTGKMKEFSANSQEVGTALADIFAGAGEDAGLKFLGVISDIDTKQDSVIDGANELEQAMLMQIKASEDLNKELASLFDATGGGFELMIAQAKLIATEWLIKMIQGVKTLYNWFVELYNGSTLFRGVISTIPTAFKLVVNAAKLMFNTLFDGIGTFGDAVKAILTGNFSDLPGIIKKGFNSSLKNAKDFGRGLGDAMKQGLESTKFGKLEKLDDVAKTVNTGPGAAPGGGTKGTVGDKTKQKTDADKSGDKAAKEAERLARIAERNADSLAKTLVDIQVSSLEESVRWVESSAKYNLEVVKNEDNAFKDRFNNLVSYNENKQAALDEAQKVELKKLDKARLEASKLLIDGRQEEYEAELVLIAANERAILDKTIDAKETLNEEIKSLTLDLLRSRYENEKDLSLQMIEDMATEELKVLAERYAKGELNEREYAKARIDLQNKTTKDYIQTEIDQLAQLIQLGRERGVSTVSLEKELAKLRVDLAKETADQQIAEIERVADMEKDAAEQRKEIYKEIANASFEFLDAVFERRISDIEKEAKLNEEERDRELDKIERSSMTDEEKALKTYAIKQKYDKKEQDLDRKKVEAQKKQAQFQKAQAVLNIGLSTATAIARAFADFPFPIAMPIAAAVGALGAVQLATALMAPLPQYYTGTDSSKGGPAHVGERGAELFVTPDGTLGMTPATDTIMNLEEGTKIFNAMETKKILSGSASNSDSVYLQKLLEEQAISTEKLVAAISSNEVHSTVITKSGWRKQSTKLKDFNKYLLRNGIK